MAIAATQVALWRAPVLKYEASTALEDRMRTFRRLVFAGIVGALAIASVAGASVPTMADCLEASDFIANAALSRDNGMTRDAFIERLNGDFAAIRAFPSDLRWFV